MMLPTLSLRSVAQSAWTKDRAKRLGDLVIAGALIALTLPLMALVALAIKCDSRGPVLFREEGLDARGRRFAALKFRSTMDVGESYNRAVPSAGVGACITRLGWYLRYTRIDNLPLLLNVLRGEISFIDAGPEHPPFLD